MFTPKTRAQRAFFVRVVDRYLGPEHVEKRQRHAAQEFAQKDGSDAFRDEAHDQPSRIIALVLNRK